MFILITFVLLFLAASLVIVLQLTRPAASYTWLAAAAGALFAWVSVLFWHLDLPRQFTLGPWTPVTLFSSSPQLFASPTSWLYALSLSAVAAAVILTSPVRSLPAGMASWLGTFALTALGLFAVLVDNLLGLVLAWMAMDLAEFVIAMRARPSALLGRSAVISFSFRLAGIAFAMWASVVGALSAQGFMLEAVPQGVGIYLLLAVGLRLGVLPLHQVYLGESSQRRGFGTLMRLTAAATSLLVLARMPAGAVDSRWLLPLFALTAFAALYGGLMWFFAADELNGRPYWVIGMGALSLSASLAGNPLGATAWGVTLILLGGISFLYSSRQVRFTRVFALLGLLMLALPFTLTASAWQGDLPIPWLFWPLFLIAHALLAGGYVRHLLGPGETQLADLPSWARAVYPIGMAVLVITVVLGGLWGWPGALALGRWETGPVSFLLFGALVFFAWRLPQFTALDIFRRPASRPSAYGTWFGVLARVILSLSQLLGDLLIYLSSLLEGDGGLLWTLLLLVLLAIFLRGL